MLQIHVHAVTEEKLDDKEELWEAMGNLQKDTEI